MQSAERKAPEDWRDDPTGLNLGKYAVVFSGGGAHGAWEIGCLRALCNHHQSLPSVRAGASAGALNAAGLTAGMSVGELVTLWTQLRPADVFLPRPPGRGWSRVGLSVAWSALTQAKRPGESRWSSSVKSIAARLPSIFDSQPLEATLRKLLMDRYMTFAQSHASVVFAATHTGSKQPHYFYRLPAGKRLQGNDWEQLDGADLLIGALMATSALPFLFPPKGALVDGGVLRNQPLGAATKLAPVGDPIYVLLPHSNSLPNAPNVANTLSTLLEFWLGSGLKHELKLLGVTNIIDDVQGSAPRPVCIVRASQSLDGIAGLLDFGKRVSELIGMGEDDMKLSLKHFDPRDPATWEEDVQPM